ncbi:MAG: ligand-binding sensor domain-containing protein, partial [Candidatus Latescibacterota bacterium]
MAELNEEALAVQPEFVWEHFTIRDGLPDMKIECIYEDSQGLVWVGTHEGGLACYDGYGFKTYTIADGLAGNGVYSAIEDDQGCMWFATDRGLCRLNDCEFETFKLGNQSRGFLWGRCKDEKGRLWFGLEREPGRGPAICCWDGEKLEEIVLAELEEDLEDVGESINAMDIDEKGRIWCGGSRLFVCEILKGKRRGQYKVIEKPKEYDNHIASINCRLGEVWIGISPGIVSHSQRSDRVGYVTLGDGGINGLLYNNIEKKSYAFSNTGDIWSIDSGNNIQAVYKNQGRFWRGGLGLGGRVIWIGTYGMGFYRISLSKILLYRAFERAESVVEGNGNLYVCCLKGILEYDVSMGILQKVKVTISDKISVCGNENNDADIINASNINRIIESQACCCVYDKRSNLLIVGTLRGYIYVINNNRVIQIINADKTGNRVNNIAVDRNERIWYRSLYGNVIGYNDSVQSTSFNKKISAMCIGKNGIAYIAEIAKNKTLIKQIDPTCDESEILGELLDIDIMVICETDDGLWFGTNSGMCRLDEGKFTFYTIDDGLSCNIVTCIKQSEDGILWI